MRYNADNTFKVLASHSHSLGSITEKLLSRRKRLFKEVHIQYSWANNELSFITEQLAVVKGLCSTHSAYQNLRMQLEKHQSL